MVILVIYMFDSGYEFSLRSICGSAKAVGAISLTGTVVPLGVALAITAFP